MLTRHETSELLKCYTSVTYFIETYVKIHHPKKGMIPFVLYPRQDDLLIELASGESFLALAARQTGLTQTVCAYILWSAIFERKKIALVAINQPIVQHTMKHLLAAYNALPEFMKPATPVLNRHEIRFDNGGSVYGGIAGHTVLLGRTLDTIIAADSAFMNEEQFRSVWEAGLPALSQSGGKIVFASSGTVFGSEFDRLWKDPEFKFNKFLMAWDSVPTRDSHFRDSMISKLGWDKWQTEFELA